MKHAPIVLFVYNRPKHARYTIRALQENTIAEYSELFIFSDGPKGEVDYDKVKSVRDFLYTIRGFKNVTIIEREKNLGLADNIVDGVTKIVNEYGKAIVLEDDIVTSPYFLKFMNEALERYESESKVMHIAGYMFPIKRDNLPDAFFLKPTTCWGWATWKRAWCYFNKDSQMWINFLTEEQKKDFNLNNTYDYWSQLKLNYEGKIKTWAIFWYLSVYASGGLSLHPKESLTKNIGHDNSGVHCGKTRNYNVKLSYKSQWSFPEEVKEHLLARKYLEEYFVRIKSRRQNRLCAEDFYDELRRILKKVLFL